MNILYDKEALSNNSTRTCSIYLFRGSLLWTFLLWVFYCRLSTVDPFSVDPDSAAQCWVIVPCILCLFGFSTGWGWAIVLYIVVWIVLAQSLSHWTGGGAADSASESLVESQDSEGYLTLWWAKEIRILRDLYRQRLEIRTLMQYIWEAYQETQSFMTHQEGW